MPKIKIYMNLIYGLEFNRSFKILFFSSIISSFALNGQINKNEYSSSIDSTFVNYFANGKPQRIQLFQFGLLNGPSWEFHSSGQLMVHNQWSKGLRNGLELTFDQAGKKIASTSWFNGRLHGEELVYYRTGVIQKRTIWSLNVKHGISIWYHDNSVKAAIYPYENGRIHGDVIYFDVNGKEESRKRYINNELFKK